ncbi:MULTISPECIES: nucleotidyltransferase family protein [Kordiimonas]|jgi:GTP:adenosylcobinamide-phosphate guanylyltransferase|uniref:nucleotidyltransferase family protein n=1 Tax=Kordiimonas TaxID=288021 RepID=UPI00257BA96C|nr:NTP transferase domain-containing protein [Kordiimonas sp. UBA4487]
MKEMAMYEFEAAHQPNHSNTLNRLSEMSAVERRFTAVVLAGTRSNTDPVASIFGGQYKALVPICGKPMVERVVDSLVRSRSVKRVVIVFDDAAQLEECCPDIRAGYDVPVEVIPCRDTICCSVGSALESAGGEWPFLVTTADHALLTSAMVDRFCTEAMEGGALSVGFVEKKHLDAEHPGSKRTYLPFRETQLSGANLFAFTNSGALPVLDFWRQIEMKRKKPWQLFKAFGYRNLLGLLFKRYTVDEAFGRASAVLGVEARAVRLPFAEAAIDVDTPKDYHQVTQILKDRMDALGTFETRLQPVS